MKESVNSTKDGANVDANILELKNADNSTATNINITTPVTSGNEVLKVSVLVSSGLDDNLQVNQQDESYVELAVPLQHSETLKNLVNNDSTGNNDDVITYPNLSESKLSVEDIKENESESKVNDVGGNYRRPKIFSIANYTPHLQYYPVWNHYKTSDEANDILSSNIQLSEQNFEPSVATIDKSLNDKTSLARKEAGEITLNSRLLKELGPISRQDYIENINFKCNFYHKVLCDPISHCSKPTYDFNNPLSMSTRM
ncbi:hypothetical protein HELRODRAFT_167072 [Helobdella robusta]|uniref:Uncharacterized protein n=1 Tax=Helobdella robusta TaxID=6412 RepID=T1EYZ1_HELRO|nr:hypothetical protein HELRODRAFT_167072 [Helobdella robusta]ESO10570.1 hypothetical protein HELRODRAFT_167072 [Helobdella robusta]